jgi:hypothetical protein
VNALRLSAPQPNAATLDCLDEEWIAAFAEGSVDPSESAAQTAHLLACARCSRQVASVARMLDDAVVADEAARLTPRRPAMLPRRRGVMTAVAGVAAAAALFLMIGRSDVPKASGSGTPSFGEPRYRESSPTGAVPPRPLAPIGDVSATDSLRWSSVARADRYRLTVFGRDGSVILETQTADTVVAVPSQVGRTVGTSYLWRVEARVGWEDRWVASDLAEFTVRPAPEPR